MNYTIRPESSKDRASIHALTEAAFRDVPHSSHTEQFIVDALRSRGELALSLVPPIAQGEVRYSAAFEASAPPVD